MIDDESSGVDSQLLNVPKSRRQSVSSAVRSAIGSWLAHLRKIGTPACIEWLKSYKVATFIADLFAALVVSAMLIPQGMVRNTKLGCVQF
jgi:hypothetical protein